MTTTFDLAWEAPSETTRQGGRTPGPLYDNLVALVARPRTWAIVATTTSAQNGNAIKQRIQSGGKVQAQYARALADEAGGTFESTARKTENGVAVYAQFVPGVVANAARRRR